MSIANEGMAPVYSLCNVHLCAMRIGLFFGSFNPIHTGHCILASYMATETDLDQVWLVVSPHNPHKERKTLANDYDRLHLVELALENHSSVKASNIEFGLPKPSYTIDTLTYLEEKYPQHEWVLIMGGDNLISLPKWKNANILMKRYDIYVYTRPGYIVPTTPEGARVTIFDDAPQMNISATYIRGLIADKKSVRYLVPDAVREHIESAGMYRRKQ